MSLQARARERRVPAPVPSAEERSAGAAGAGRSEERPWAPEAAPGMHEPQLDLDVTVLAFAQWVSEMKARHHSSQHQMQAEMSMIRNAIASNHTDLSDFKRHGAAIQQQMQSEIHEIRENLSNVFIEITAAVRNNAAADQDVKLKIQSLNEQAVRNETAFAQLADAADQSQSKLRNAVTEMQFASERMRDDLGALNRQTDGLQTAIGERSERISADVEQLTQELHSQLDRRKEHLRKMVADVQSVGESLQALKADFEEQRRGAGEAQGRLQASIHAAEQATRRGDALGARSLPTTAEVLQPGARYLAQVHVPQARAVPMAGVVYR